MRPLALLLLLTLAGCGSGHNCDYCHDRTWEERIDVHEFKICPRCWTELDYMAGRIYGNKWCAERIVWVYDEIERHRK